MIEGPPLIPQFPYMWRAVTVATLTGPGGFRRRPYWDLLLECGHSKEDWQTTGTHPPGRVRCYQCPRETEV